MKRITCLILAFCAVLITSCSSSVIARVEFSGSQATQQQRKIEYDFSAFDGKCKELDQQLGIPPTYKNIGADINEDTLLASLNMEDAVSKKLKDEDGKQYTSGEKVLILYENGYISYSNSELYGKALTISDKQCTELAEAFISANNIDRSELVAKPLQDSGNTKMLVYKRKINGIDVVGNTGMCFYFSGDGICNLYHLSSKYDADKPLNIELIGVEAALNLLLTDKSSQNFGRSFEESGTLIKTVRVEEVQIVYWDNMKTQYWQTHIQPVYLFTGTAIDEKGKETRFTGYVRAISDDRTSNFHMDSLIDEI